MKRLLFFAHLLLFSLRAESPEVLLERFQEQGLPAAPLQERYREGRAKAVPDEQIAAALTARALHLQQARQLLQAHGYPLNAPPVQELWPTLARVLEAGMPPGDAESLLTQAGGQFAGRLAPLFEVADSLRLAGLNDETVLLLLHDFFERGLSRSELLRAARSARQLHAEGLRGEELRQRLEVSTPARGGRGGPGRHGGNH